MKCRICYKKTIRVFSLGKIAISDFTITPEDGHKTPLNLVWCKYCKLLQFDRHFDRRKLYNRYWYESSLNPVIKNNLKYIGSKCRGLLHIDIGGNDGTLLKYSKARIKYSVDPSPIKPHTFEWFKTYWENTPEFRYIDVITAIAVLYAIPDPNVFMAKVKRALAPSGVFITQLMTLAPMIKNNDIGNICHEHVCYYSYRALVRLFERNGLEIYKVETNRINGGSYLIFARHYKNGSVAFKEPTLTLKEMKAFYKRCCVNRDKMRRFFKTHNVIGFGASTKANTIMQWYRITPLYIMDIHPDKIGKYPIATTSHIVPEAYVEGHYYWVFPYGFINYFKKKHPEYKFVTSIPHFAKV